VADWQVGGLADWLVGGLADWQVGGLAGWRIGRLAGWQVWQFLQPELISILGNCLNIHFSKSSLLI